MSQADDILSYIKPYVLNWIQIVVNKNEALHGSTQVHALNGYLHTGTLDDDQAPQFLMLDGSRALTGNLAVGSGITLDGVDLSALSSSFSAHATATATAGHGAVGAHNHQSTANGGLLDHGAALTGLGDDDHTQYLNVTRHDVTSRHTLGTVVPHDAHSALSGLTSGDDHTQYLNTARHDTAIRHTLGSVVPHDTHSSLSGLTADDHTQYYNATRHTLAVHTGLGLVPTTLTISAGTGLSGGGDLSAARSFALAYGTTIPSSLTPSTGSYGSSAEPARVDHKHVLSVQAPTTNLGVASTNADSASNYLSTSGHTHAIASNSTPGAAASLLATNAAGLLTLAQFAVQGQSILQTTIPQTSDTYDLGSYSAWWRQSFISQLNGVVFAENTVTLYGGWLMICKDQGSLAAAVASANTTVNFGKTMTVGDVVAIKGYTSAGVTAVEYLQVGSLVSGTIYNVTRDLAGANSTDPAWAMGAPFAVYGTTGNGRIELNAYDTPRVSLFVKTGSGYAAETEYVRLGDLTGWQGAGLIEYGQAMGNYASGQYMYYTPNLGLNINGTINATSGSLGALSIAGALSIGTNGGIYQGSGSFASPTTGLKMWNSGGIGQIAGYNAGALQWYEGTDGKLYAGAGNVLLDANGISLVAGLTSNQRFDKISWQYSIGGTEESYISSYGVPLSSTYTLEMGSSGSVNLFSSYVPSGSSNAYASNLTLDAQYGLIISKNIFGNADVFTSGSINAENGIYAGGTTSGIGGTGGISAAGVITGASLWITTGMGSAPSAGEILGDTIVANSTIVATTTVKGTTGVYDGSDRVYSLSNMPPVVTTSANGYCPKLPGTTTTFLDGNGAYTTPAIASLSGYTPPTAFTPALLSTGATFAYSTRVGYYSVCAKVCTFSLCIQLSATPTGTLTNAVQVTGLPVACSSQSGIQPTFSDFWSVITFPTNYTQLQLYMGTNTSIINLLASRSGYGNTYLLASNLASGTQIFITGQYITN